jgi:hypothetical protein
LPFLEASLIESGTRGKQAILEVIRLSPNISEFEMAHLLGKSVEEAYGNLIVIRRLQDYEKLDSVRMLKDHLVARNDEILRLLFYALWVYHADMRLMYQALQSENSSVAVEMVETSIRGDNLPYILPLIDDMPIDEKIEKGRKLFNLISRDHVERLLALLAYSDDRVTRMLSVLVMSDLMPNPALVPVVESRLEDDDLFVRQVAEYASAKAAGRESHMPEALDLINNLKEFALFEGLGTRELHAVASITKLEKLSVGDILLRAGEENPSIYLVKSGRITIWGNYGQPDQKEIRVVEKGGYLNFVPMFDGLPPSNTTVVSEAAEVFVIPQSQFHEIMRVYPHIGINLLRIAATMFRRLEISA